MSREPIANLPPSSPDVPARPSTLRRLASLAVGLLLGSALLWWVGGGVWETYREYRRLSLEAETSAPIGYEGVSLRRSYNDKPSTFFAESDDGRSQLWAARGADGSPEYYDVTDADFEVERLSGGFGRDSIPGIDYPLFEGSDSPRVGRFGARHEFYGLDLETGARGYPRDLLRKIEVVNDEAEGIPFAIVFDRQHDQARCYDRRIDGAPVTFGTTGYALGESADPKQGRPLLYDRKTRSLWLPEDDVLACVNGPLRGTRLPTVFNPEPMSWSEWSGRHPETLVLVGSDRDNDLKPIPDQ